MRQRTALSQAAVAVAAISAGALYLKLIVLLHPAMPVGDALFHAHRFQWVLEGRYYFTSIAPGLYEFPYPVGFYLLASPLVLFTQSAEQYTTLVRVAGTVAQVGAALALYSMVVRAWGDRAGGATAVGMFHLLPVDHGRARHRKLDQRIRRICRHSVPRCSHDRSTSSAVAPRRYGNDRDHRPRLPLAHEHVCHTSHDGDIDSAAVPMGRETMRLEQ